MKINKIKNLKYIFFFLFAIGLVSACKINAPVKYPAAVKMPGTFTPGISDTNGIGFIPVEKFFTDKYLVNLIDTALKNNLDLQIAMQRINMSRTNVMISKAALLPSLSASTSAGVRKYGTYTMDGVGNYDTRLSPNVEGDRMLPDPMPNYFLGLESNWEIDVWGKLRNMKKAAVARYLASEKGRQLIVTSLIAEVASLYYDLLALDNQLEILRQNISLQETALELIKIQKDAGKVTELAVQQFHAQLLNTKSLEVQIQQQIIADENRLNLLLGRYPQQIVRGKPIRAQEFPKDVDAGIPTKMLLRRPDIQQAELELAAAKADINAARFAFFPSLNIHAFGGLESFNASFLFRTPESIAYGLVAGLTAPIFQQNRIRANYKRAEAENMAAFYSYQKAVITAYQEVATSLRLIENYEKIADLKTQEVDVLLQAVGTSSDLFLSGYATYLEVITAQRTVLEAELGLANTKKERFLALIELYRALGGGWK